VDDPEEVHEAPESSSEEAAPAGRKKEDDGVDSAAGGGTDAVMTDAGVTPEPGTTPEPDGDGLEALLAAGMCVFGGGNSLKLCLAAADRQVALCKTCGALTYTAALIAPEACTGRCLDFKLSAYLPAGRAEMSEPDADKGKEGDKEAEEGSEDSADSTEEEANR
jgi:hypothetical protein